MLIQFWKKQKQHLPQKNPNSFQNYDLAPNLPESFSFLRLSPHRIFFLQGLWREPPLLSPVCVDLQEGSLPGWQSTVKLFSWLLCFSFAPSTFLSLADLDLKVGMEPLTFLCLQWWEGLHQVCWSWRWNDISASALPREPVVVLKECLRRERVPVPHSQLSWVYLSVFQNINHPRLLS